MKRFRAKALDLATDIGNDEGQCKEMVNWSRALLVVEEYHTLGISDGEQVTQLHLKEDPMFLNISKRFVGIPRYPILLVIPHAHFEAHSNSALIDGLSENTSPSARSVPRQSLLCHPTSLYDYSRRQTIP